jgi:L-lactate dehydrogenase complex protein LldG
MKRAVESFRINVARVLKTYPDTRSLAEEARRIKEYSIDHMDELVEKACKSLERNGARCYVAKTAEEARRIVSEIVGSGKVVVKGKSMVTEEIGLREHLERMGNEVWETDLGEFIIQLAKERPMHITAPAIHMTKERVARLFRERLGIEVEADIAKLASAAREFLRKKIVSADVGISGANAVAADTGSLVILENEGNVRLSTGFPPVYVAVVGIEKVVPTLRDAIVVAEVTWRHAGYLAPSYVNIVSGPSKTGDIEKTIVYGAQGPKEMHVTFVDNGRSAMAKHPLFKQALYCLKCGACMFECPIFDLVAGHYGDIYPGGIGIVWSYFVGGDPERLAPLFYACALCYRCKERCPMKIDTPKMIVALRNELAKRGLAPPKLVENVSNMLKDNESIIEELERKLR